MKKSVDITEAELRIMKALWADSPRLASDLAEELGKATGWKANTVKTLLGRLVKKRAVAASRRDKAYAYEPAVSEEECQVAQSLSFLDRMFDGSFNMMVSRLIDADRLSKKDIEELKAMLDDKRKGKKRS